MSIHFALVAKESDGKEALTTYQLDFVELPCSHSGKNMAEALARVLKEFGIEGKVSYSDFYITVNHIPI